MSSKTVIYFVGACLLLSVVGIVALSTGLGDGKPIPDVLQNIAIGALTGLVGLLVPRDDEPRRKRSDGGYVGPEVGRVLVALAVVLIGLFVLVWLLP